MTAPSDGSEDAFREDAPAGDSSGEGEIDISLLEDSLRLTPWQRLVENDRALALVRMMEQAKIRKDGAA
jgi:hypothetical protein